MSVFVNEIRWGARRFFESFCRGGKSVLLKAVQVGLVNGSRWPLGPPDVRSRASQGKGLSGGGQVIRSV